METKVKNKDLLFMWPLNQNDFDTPVLQSCTVSEVAQVNRV